MTGSSSSSTSALMKSLFSSATSSILKASAERRRSNNYCSSSSSITIINRFLATSQFPSRKFAKPLKTKQYGIDVLHDPLWNKGMAFDFSERDRLGLRGLLPPRVKTIEEQLDKAMHSILECKDDIAKNLYLQDLHQRNETLYHRLLIENIEMMAPLVYTPTVGHVCQQFGNQYTRARGMFFSRDDRGLFHTMCYNWPHDNVKVIVVTDGSRILGLGDLGVNGMGIPIGKLALYIAAGGLAPHRVLPVALDVGCDNEQLRNSPNYVGLRVPRLQGQEYYDMIDEFMDAVFSRWPDVVVQFEDFETSKAVPLLERYRDKYRCFNDDIQGTGCVVLAGLMSAARNAGSSLKEMRVLCAGAGSAGLGVCSQVVDGMVEAGLSRKEAKSRVVVATHLGAIGRRDGSRGDPNYGAGLVTERELPWASEAVADGTPMVEVVQQFKPNVLMGMTARAGVFSEELVRAMAAASPRPVIMPLSNPTSKAECTPEEAYRWTDGAAVVATGSPYPPMEFKGKTIRPSQCNNMYVFPGIGLAASVAGVKRITDKMLYRAAVACAGSMTPDEVAEGRTFPSVTRIRDVSHAVACAVIEEALDRGLTTSLSRKQMADDGVTLEALVARKMYYPNYVPLIDPRKA